MSDIIKSTLPIKVFQYDWDAKIPKWVLEIVPNIKKTNIGLEMPPHAYSIDRTILFQGDYITLTVTGELRCIKKDIYEKCTVEFLDVNRQEPIKKIVKEVREYMNMDLTYTYVPDYVIFFGKFDGFHDLSRVDQLLRRGIKGVMAINGSNLISIASSNSFSFRVRLLDFNVGVDE